ncbi:hypothetical protein [Alsobacter soli]|nr:hypothetical protein [Alsobacter soli]
MLAANENVLQHAGETIFFEQLRAVLEEHDQAQIDDLSWAAMDVIQKGAWLTATLGRLEAEQRAAAMRVAG